MLVKILAAGSGGQGVLTLGNILGNAAMLDDFYVTFLPSYGAAMRGGTANCTVCVSDEEIASPVASNPDVLLAMNSPSIFAFINRLEPGGELLYNSDLTDNLPERGDLEIFPVPANRIARELGNERSANMVMLGSLVKLIEIVRLETVLSSVELMMADKKKLVEMSLRAIRAGFEGFPFSIN